MGLWRLGWPCYSLARNRGLMRCEDSHLRQFAGWFVDMEPRARFQFTIEEVAIGRAARLFRVRLLCLWKVHKQIMMMSAKLGIVLSGKQSLAVLAH